MQYYTPSPGYPYGYSPPPPSPEKPKGMKMHWRATLIAAAALIGIVALSKWAKHDPDSTWGVAYAQAEEMVGGPQQRSEPRRRICPRQQRQMAEYEPEPRWERPYRDRRGETTIYRRGE